MEEGGRAASIMCIKHPILFIATKTDQKLGLFDWLHILYNRLTLLTPASGSVQGHFK